MDADPTPDRKFVKTNTAKSNWRPVNQELYKIPIPIRLFADKVKYKLTEMTTHTQHFKPNLPKRQSIAIKRLLRRSNEIVIKLADKGSGVVVMTKEQYKKEADRQLSNTNHYKKLDKDETELIRSNIKQATERYMEHGLISAKSMQNNKQLKYQTR